MLGDHSLIAPHLLPAELASVLRGRSPGGLLSDDDAARAVEEFADLRIELVDVMPLLPAVWEMRHDVSAYDAMYVALARAVDAPLLTLDRGMAAAASDCALLPSGDD